MNPSNVWRRRLLFLLLLAPVVLITSRYSDAIIKSLDQRSDPMPSTLQVLFEKTASPFNFHPLNVDMIENNAVVQNVVGTLFRIDRAHRRSPYLAQSWTAKNGGMTWEFELRPNLLCEDGTPINAPNFKESLERILKLRLKSSSSMPTIDHLKGWDHFRIGKSSEIAGITANSATTLVLEFEKPVQEELLAFLSLAHFGFFCKSDFTEAGEWRNENNITSSGPYRLAERVQTTPLKLLKRTEWPMVEHDAYDVVEFIQTPAYLEKLDETKSQFVVVTGLNEPRKVSGYVGFHGALNRLTALVITQNKRSFIHASSITREVAAGLRGENQNLPFPSDRFVLASNFFAQASSISTRTTSPNSSTGKDLVKSSEFRKLTLGVRPTASPDLVSHARSLIERTMKNLGVKADVSVVTVNAGDTEKNTRFLSNQEFDFRLATVVTGTSYASWMAKMMFCSNLGIQFPDPDGRICDLASQTDEIKSAESFETVLAEQNAVVPLFHSGAYWLHSLSIDTSKLSPFSAFPSLDMLRPKK